MKEGGADVSQFRVLQECVVSECLSKAPNTERVGRKRKRFRRGEISQDVSVVSDYDMF